MKKAIKVLFLGKANDRHCQEALSFLEGNVECLYSYLGVWGQKFPDEIVELEFDYIVSYLSRWIVPSQILKKAKLAAINFHPASPDFPGIGCNNFALYEGASEYGVTCHHMEKIVDTGGIIAVKRFPVFETDNVSSLLSRAYDFQLNLFYEILGAILLGKPLPSTNERWTKKPYSRKEFNELCRLTIEMPHEEIARRIRATDFGNFRPTIEVGGFTFQLL